MQNKHTTYEKNSYVCIICDRKIKDIKSATTYKEKQIRYELDLLFPISSETNEFLSEKNIISLDTIVKKLENITKSPGKDFLHIASKCEVSKESQRELSDLLYIGHHLNKISDLIEERIEEKKKTKMRHDK